jgi:hypothetical protein
VKAAVARSDKGGALALDIADAFLESDLMQSLSAGQWVNGSTTATANATTAAANVDVDFDQDNGVHSDNGSAAAASDIDGTDAAAAAADASGSQHGAERNADNNSVDDTQSWADEPEPADATGASNVEQQHANSSTAAGRSRSASPSRAATQRAHTGAAAAGAGATGSTAAAASRDAHRNDDYAYSVPSDFGGSSIASESEYIGSRTRQQQQQQQQQRQYRHASTAQQQQQQRKDYSGWVGDYAIGKRATAVSGGTATTAGTVRGRDEAWTIPNATANSSNLKGVVQSGTVSRGSGVWEVLVDVPQRSAATSAAAAAAAAGGSSSSGARYRVID